MFRGRKVTDPVVQGSASGGLESKPTGLTKAWDTVGKARADLRKIEHRLDQAERHPPLNHLNPTGETSITDYGSLAWNRDHDATYDVADEYASGVVVDNYGRSAYLKSKTNAARKVSRHDDKHIERADDAENRQKKSKSHGNHVGRHKPHTLHLQEKHYNRLDYNSHGMNDRRVEFSDRVNLRENSTSNQHGYNSSSRDRRPLELIPDAHSTLTDSRDIRETEINFLNNNLTQDIDTNEQFLGGNPASRLTHVSVTVPGSTQHNKAGSVGYSGAGTQQRARPGSHFLDMISENSNSEMDGRASDNSLSDTESSKGRRFKADIRNIDPDGLAKIKETIRKQIKSSTSSKETNEELAGATGGDQAQSLGYAPTHTLHDANEPLMPRSQDLIEGSEKNHTKVRKIAAGPAPPSYKGFSEAEVRYRIVENKVPKSDSNKKDKKRVVSIKVQEKKIEPHSNWLTVEDSDGGKSKKVTRVIAPSRKQNKQQAQPKNKEIITTSSWRAGQELILRELGPLKIRKSSRGRDSNSDIDGHESPMEERPEALGVEDMDNLGVGSATAAEIQHHKALSEEARRVYSDLQMDEDSGNPGKWNPSSLEKEKRWKAPTKRKARTSESEKHQQPSAKQRHYDQEQVRKYMQKQKAERLKRQKEEEMKHKEEEEARKKHLEELYNKQKQATVGSGPKKEKSSKQRIPGNEAGQKTSLGDLPRHHPFHTDRPKYVVSSDSENKENMNAEDNMELSDSSSTLTGDEDELTPTGTPRRAKMDIDSPSNKKQTVNSLTREINKVGSKSRTVNASKPPDNVPSNTKTIDGFTFDVGVVTSKFTQALQERLNEDPASSYNNGAFSSVNNQDGNRQGVSRADRIQAIKETAATLQNRLKAEAKKIEAQGANKITENGATYNPSVRWNDLEPSRPRDEEYVSRYERVTAAKEDFTVFKSNLPGNQPEARLNAPNVMSSMPAGSSGSKKDYVEDNTLTETSTFSEITLTDDSDDDEVSHGKIGAGLKHQEFHTGSKSGDKPAPLNIPRPKNVQTAPKASNSWEDPVTDDFNVFSVYSRQQQERIIRPGREPMTKKKPSSTYSAPVEEEVVRASQAPANQASVGTSKKGDMSSRRAESPYGSRSESLRTQSPSLKMKSRTGSVMSKPPEPSDDETIDEDSYTNSFETEDKTTSRGKVVSESVPQSHKSLPTSMKSTSVKSASVKSTLKKSDRVAPQQESSVDEDISEGDLTPQAEASMSDTEPKDPPRLSPNSLERKFYSEFHNLESMEMSLKQLTGVERTRAVSMAQQETVSLAQILKAKQQGYDIQMKEIQLKAQLEATEATKQLEEARKRASEAAINAADMIAKVRGEGVTSIQESTRKLIDTQTAAAKATAEAAKYLSEARSRGNKDTTHLAVKMAASAAASAVNTVLEKKRKSSNQTGGAKPKVYSKTAKRRTDEPVSHEESDIDDYSVHFDEQMTEDEIEEKSFRLILPSESHRKKGRHHSDNESVTSEGSAPKVIDSDLQSLFAGVESFDRFTDDIVKQFMKEEELRAHHQASLLRLREEALVEKTKAELQWLEQQRKRIRNKGADDSYPQIAKRETRLKEKLQEQQAEIRKMREEQKKAAKERQRQLLEEISKRKGSKSQSLVKGRLGRPNEVHTEFEVSSIDEASDVEKQPKKDYKSDSEIYTEPKVSGRKTKHDTKDGEKYKKINLDEKFLTMRHHKLVNRRKNAEELLKWKKRLDEEEKRVFNLEKKVLKVWDKKDGPQKEKDPSSIKSVIAAKDESETYKKDPVTNGTTRDSTIRTAASEAKDSTVISEIISTARDSSIQENYITASIESSPDEKHIKMLTDKSNIKKPPRSGSESSITEEIPFSPDESKKLNDSSDDTMTQSYSETFDESATPTPKTASKKTGKTTPKSPLENLKKLRNASPRSSPRSLFSRSQTRNSESESEDSISHTESQSELSDFEGRIRALNEDLRRRKTEADRLKRETKKKRRELMKNKELTLKKQIEAYDNQINQLKIDLHKEMTHETAKTTVRPKIKQPKVSPPKGLKSTSVTPPKLRTETDSSGPDSTQVSPDIQEDTGKRKKADVSEPISSKSALEKISEGSESITSRSEKSDPTYKEKNYSQKGSSVEEESVVEEIEEDIASIASEPSDDKTKEMKIDLHTKEDLYDVSTVYTDFETEPVSHNATQHDKVPLSARSFGSDDQPQSARSVTEAISEYIPEHVSAASASESIVRQFDLKQQVNTNDIDQNNEDPSEKDLESDNDNSISFVESSRPSSGRSERSIPSYQTEHESSESSEKSPALIQEKLDDVVHDEVSEPSSSYSKKKPVGMSSRNLFDIDDLLGPPDEDDLTPLGSPKSKDETSRDMDSGNFFDALTDFNIGDRVTVTGTNRERCAGKLMFKGNVKFAPGIWVGVELDKPEGRHDGVEEGTRYFKCKNKHGLIVPGHDLQPETDEGGQTNDNVRASMESTVSVDTDEGDLARLIREADKNVQMFDKTPEPSPRSPQKENDKKARNERLADLFTDDLLASVIQKDMDIISDIAAKQQSKKNATTTTQKKAPPVAPKPSKDHTASPVLTNGDIQHFEEQHQTVDQPTQQTRNLENTANDTVKKLVNESIDHMLAIRSNRQNMDKDQSRDSGNFTDGIEEEHQEGTRSPTDELKGVLDRQDDEGEGLLDTPLRPGSPVPGLQSHKESHKPVEDSGNFDGEYEDELWLPPKEPPPYSSGENNAKPEVGRPDLRKLADEVFYAVPHQTEEINSIVSSAVDEYWTQRRYGESLSDVQPSENYFTQEENGTDLNSSSRRVFKRLLFDLTGEIVRSIYKEEENDSPAPWKKPKHKQNKYHKGIGTPTTVDVLKPAVQEAVIDILGLNGSKKPDRSRWGVRNKKKDLVDNILVQELREEEPEWVNYDDDELAVKMQLTETIFENLLTDTVHTMNRIYRRKQSLQQQQ